MQTTKMIVNRENRATHNTTVSPIYVDTVICRRTMMTVSQLDRLRAIGEERIYRERREERILIWVICFSLILPY